jgi:phenylalanyl-tRNA synthetase beta chain
MKVSINTAQYYAGEAQMMPNGPSRLLATIGEQLGAVETIEYFAPKYEGVVVVKVISCEKHPNADKLNVCRVDDGGVVANVERGDDGFVQVVCGAPNVRSGLLVAWIPPKVTVPTTHGTSEPFVLEPKELRGVISNGMLASASELGLSDNHDGLLEIDSELEVWTESGAVGPSAGMPFEKLYGLDDIVVDLENKMFTHRPDCFGVLGVARELAGIQGQSFRSPDWYLEKPVFDEPKSDTLPLEVKIIDTKNVPRLMVVAMDGLVNGQSPMWMQAALTRMGIRPISTIVDITNFIMQLTGQPLHAYDYDKLAAISGSTPTLLARSAADKEKIVLLSGKELELGNEAVVIATDKEPIGLAGIMGGDNTEVDEHTTRIIIEVASFDMYNIRRSCMKYGVFSDAATRFNKGQSSLQNDRIISYAMKLFAEHCGARQAGKVFDIQEKVKTYRPVTVTAEFINIRLGSQLSAQEISEILNRTELESSVDGQSIVVAPPFWRTDIELPEDVVEEVGRLYGYHLLPVALPRRAASVGTKDTGLAIKNRTRAILSSAGANEILTYNFVHGNLLDTFGQQREKALQLSNALSPDLQYYRMTLLPNILDKVHANIKAGFGEFGLFEMGKTHNNFHLDESDFNLPKECSFLAFVYAADSKAAKHKNGAAYFQAQKYLSFLLTKLGIAYSLKPIEGELPDLPVTKPYDPKRSAYVLDDEGAILGMVGEFQASASKKLKLPEYVAGFEIDTDAIAVKADKIKYQPSSKFPKIEQDISLKISETISFNTLKTCLQDALAEKSPEGTVASLQALDIYKADGEDTKNISFRLTIASQERTLKSSEVNSLLDSVADSAAKSFGAERI